VDAAAAAGVMRESMFRAALRVLRTPMTLEAYFRAEFGEGKIDHALRAHVADGEVLIYIHPDGRDGRTTPLLVVEGNTVRAKFPQE
jgi:hypothetical protein